VYIQHLWHVFVYCNGPSHFVYYTHGKLLPFFRKRYQLPVRNTKWLKNGKLRRAILSAFYNISQRNFGILLILWCSFKLWWNVCLDLSRSNFCSLGNRSIVLLILQTSNWFVHEYIFSRKPCLLYLTFVPAQVRTSSSAWQ
jgi:hypothetical protein